MMQKLVFSILAGVALLSSCAPVNRLTQAKRVPRVYSVNYNYPNVIADRSEINQKAWVVYSDRAGNVATLKPGGKLSNQELKFLEPLLVVGKKGDYYRVVKYAPDILKGERLTNRKGVKYYGWIHRDRLLLFNNSVTEIRNGIKLKSTTAITDTTAVLHANSYFDKDSMKVFTQPSLEEPAPVKVGLNSVVYVLKRVENDTRALIAFKTDIAPDKVGETVCGWVDASVIVPMGQRLVLNDGRRYGQSPFLFAPVVYADVSDSTMQFRTLTATPVIDKSLNRVYNVNGDPISYRQSIELEDKLSHINVIFAFDPTENVVKQLPMLANAVQNMKTTFQTGPSEFNYRFAAIVGEKVVPMTTDYASMADSLMSISKVLVSTNLPTDTSTLLRAVDIAGKMPQATNIIVYAGETASGGEEPNKEVTDRFIRNNCRLLSFQVYADNENRYNNFVLQSTAIIDAYAKRTVTSKREQIIYPGQLRSEHVFTEYAKNRYRLNFPDQSMTQGMVLFPEKKQILSAEEYAAAVDTLAKDVRKDNAALVASLRRGFAELGNHKDRYDQAFASRYDIALAQKPDTAFTKAFTQTTPRWVVITGREVIPVDSATVSGISLLLTEAELKTLNEFSEDLASMQVDIKSLIKSYDGKARKVRRVLKDIAGVPADAHLDSLATVTVMDSTYIKQYMPTGKVRRHLMKTYLIELRNCYTGVKNRDLTLARAQEFITTCPTVNPLLMQIRIRDLRSRKVVSDAQLEELCLYYKRQKELADKSAKPAGELNIPQGEKYYYLPTWVMP